MTDRELASRVTLMSPGASIVYYRGRLAEDSYKQPEVAALRDMAQRLSVMRIVYFSGDTALGMGMLTLSQRRVGGVFEYIATRLS